MRFPLAALLLVTACASESATPEESTPDVRSGGKADGAFVAGPMYLSGAFDGSQRFAMWVDTMKFARHIRDDLGKPFAFTYFINTAYYDHTVKGSWIGTSDNAREETVRWALTQQAVNEGHEIGDHTVRHQDGSKWTLAQWRAELREFHGLVEKHLFDTVLDDQGQPLFPRWRPAPQAAAGQTGAACQTDDECAGHHCLAVTPTQGFCTQGCNVKIACPNDTVCGTPGFTSDQDVCVPMPEYPVEHNGQVLFDENGAPNLANPELQPYKIVGFRAPQLGQNAALYQTLTELGYRYDTSMVLPPGPPARTARGGQVFQNLYQFPLMKNPGSLTIPMDYNYYVDKGAAARMQADYRKSLVDSYARGHMPWNIGHHFALWQNGGYWAAMKDAFEFAAGGCPDAAGQSRCADVEFVTFGQLADKLDGKADGPMWIDDGLEGEAVEGTPGEASDEDGE
jgi:hypothetical protein